MQDVAQSATSQLDLTSDWFGYVHSGWLGTEHTSKDIVHGQS